MTQNTRTKEEADLIWNNLLFRFDYATKKLQYLKSDCDIMLYKICKINKKKRIETKIRKNLLFSFWINNVNIEDN